jgi:hypothetical protein
LKDFKEAFERVNHWKKKGGRFLPHCQPYRDLNNPRQIIPQWQKDLAGWLIRSGFLEAVSLKTSSRERDLSVVNILITIRVKQDRYEHKD